ncbi:hypothetical protein ACWDSD_39310, partial [Streptomyces spiralis]
VQVVQAEVDQEPVRLLTRQRLKGVGQALRVGGLPGLLQLPGGLPGCRVAGLLLQRFVQLSRALRCEGE